MSYFYYLNINNLFYYKLAGFQMYFIDYSRANYNSQCLDGPNVLSIFQIQTSIKIFGYLLIV